MQHLSIFFLHFLIQLSDFSSTLKNKNSEEKTLKKIPRFPTFPSFWFTTFRKYLNFLNKIFTFWLGYDYPSFKHTFNIIDKKEIV